jgi:hypothetical protein
LHFVVVLVEPLVDVFGVIRVPVGVTAVALVVLASKSQL